MEDSKLEPTVTNNRVRGKRWKFVRRFFIHYVWPIVHRLGAWPGMTPGSPLGGFTEHVRFDKDLVIDSICAANHILEFSSPYKSVMMTDIRIWKRLLSRDEKKLWIAQGRRLVRGGVDRAFVAAVVHLWHTGYLHDDPGCLCDHGTFSVNGDYQPSQWEHLFQQEDSFSATSEYWSRYENAKSARRQCAFHARHPIYKSF